MSCFHGGAGAIAMMIDHLPIIMTSMTSTPMIVEETLKTMQMVDLVSRVERASIELPKEGDREVALLVIHHE